MSGAAGGQRDRPLRRALRARSTRRTTRSRLAELRANAWLLRPVLDLLNVVLLAAVIGMFGLRSQGGALGAVEVGVLYAFISYIARVVEPLIQITMQFSQLQQAHGRRGARARAAEGSRGAARPRRAAQ